MTDTLWDHLRSLIDAQGPDGYVMSYALEAALKAPPTLNRDAVAEVLLEHNGITVDAESVSCVCGHRYEEDEAWTRDLGYMHRADAIVALARPENEVREHIAREIEAGRHADCADGQHQPCSVCWALSEVARNARSGDAS